ncbi:MAG: cupin domain-containing protein [Chitinophagaceae bacterium]|nr:cupin domain-containing protein [Chitinophagaceae bacterium]
MKKSIFERSELAALTVANPLFDVTYIHTPNITVAFNLLKQGAEVPVHKHEHETIDYVEEGTLQMTIGSETHVLTRGMVASVASYVTHSAVALSDCKVINIFYPARNDFK